MSKNKGVVAGLTVGRDCDSKLVKEIILFDNVKQLKHFKNIFPFVGVERIRRFVETDPPFVCGILITDKASGLDTVRLYNSREIASNVIQTKLVRDKGLKGYKIVEATYCQLYYSHLGRGF